jgi:uncharacterized protein YyaL (SSP411 family)
MRRIRLVITGLLALIPSLLPSAARAAATTAPAIAWQPWSDGQFVQAKREHRLVILDLEAVWCHWCHVMDTTTYADPAVERLLNEHYVAVRVDQDSRPDISDRYEDYGWPATVIFDSSGRELAKRRGYIPPDAMASMLQAFVDDPTPGPSIVAETTVHPSTMPALDRTQRTELIGRLKSDYDFKNEGWFGEQKYIDPGVLEYCLTYGGDDLRKLACRTLDANTKLIDPAWGGVDQYSTDGDWDHPHFEKIMSTQTGNLRSYSLAYRVTGEAAYLRSAQKIAGYLHDFLTSPEGAFYTSQDADLVPGEHSAEYFKLDDGARRKLGVPRIDQHIYARENGWAIQSLCALYAANNDPRLITSATAAADWVIKNRSVDGGGFRHDATDPSGPYLGDSVAMGRAFLSLYECTADRQWLARAEDAARFIRTHFLISGGASGLATSAIGKADNLQPRPEIDENIDGARFANLLFAYAGDVADRDLANNLMRFLASPQIWSNRGWAVGGILLADREIGSTAPHFTIVGSKSDSTAATLFHAALAAPMNYKRLDWFDPQEGKLPNTDVEYPALPYAAAFVCTGSACSSPMRSAAALSAKIQRIEKSEQQRSD